MTGRSQITGRNGTGEDGFVARVIGEGESPAWWGIPVGRVGGCSLRVHLVAPVYALAAVAHALWNDLGAPYVLLGLAALGAAVVLHEAVRGHVLVRWSGLRPIDVTFWPLGAVWRFEHEATARGEARAATVALAASGVVAAAFGAGVAAVAPGGWRLLLDVFVPAVALGSLQGSTTLETLGLVALWQAYAMSLFVFLANCLPMLPLDAAVALRGGRGPGAGRVAAWGLVVASVLVVGGMVTGLTAVSLLGVCGAVVCWFEWQSSRFAVDPAGVDRWRAALDEPSEARERREGVGPISEEDREQVERVLAKISAEGIASLTRAERRLLHKATERLRGG